MHFDMPNQDDLEQILAEGTAQGFFKDVSIESVRTQVGKRINHLRNDTESLRAALAALETEHDP